MFVLFFLFLVFRCWGSVVATFLLDFAIGFHFLFFVLRHVNVRHLPTPFGGVKGSGDRREGGTYALDFYTDLKTIALPLRPPHVPKFGK